MSTVSPYRHAHESASTTTVAKTVHTESWVALLARDSGAALGYGVKVSAELDDVPNANADVLRAHSTEDTIVEIHDLDVLGLNVEAPG